MDKLLILKKVAEFPQAFKILPFADGAPNERGTWSKYSFDSSVNFWINSGHPEANEFYNQQIKLIEGYKMTNELVASENRELMVSAGTSIEQSRAVAETQAAMLVAKKFPRDENIAHQKIITACKRMGLAESSLYAYKRGTSLITGPTIRLAETMARYFGNMTYGFREISRTSISSEIETFCWDMENNVRATRVFTVKHWRDTQAGGYEIKGERDKYELIANNAQRRVRACILEMIPGDIVEDAEKQCKETLAGGDGKSIEERIESMLKAFTGLNVTKDDIESFLTHKTRGIVPAELVKLQQIYKSIKDGIAKKEDFFNSDQSEKPASNDVKKQEKKKDPKPKAKKETKPDLCKEVKQAITMQRQFPAKFNQAQAELKIAILNIEDFTKDQALAIGKRVNEILDIENDG